MSGNTDLDALVIRNIGDIEAAIKHAQAEIGPEIWREVSKTTQDACNEAWIVIANPEDDELWMADHTWMVREARKPKADLRLNLNEREGADGDTENSWLATFVAGGPNGATMAFWVEQQILSASAWRKLIKTNDEIVASLRGVGFSVDDDDDRRLYIPLVLDRELLARAFENDDFDSVMEPVKTAVHNAMSAAPFLSRLRDAACAAAS